MATAAAVSLLFGAGGALLVGALTAPGGDAVETAPGAVAPGDWAAVAEATANSVVAIQVPSGENDRGSQGSGVVWDDQGRIVTNHHVVADAPGGRVSVLIGTHVYPATVVGSDPATDLAVLQLAAPAPGLVPLPRADAEALRVGDEVAAIGNPLGLSGSVTTGIVSALDRPISTGGTAAQPVITNAIQTSAALNPGNSGGALVDRSGLLIGINSAIATVGGGPGGGQSGNIGIGFAIPVDLAERIAAQLIADGAVEHAYLGVVTTDATAEARGAERLGAEVVSVVEGGPSADAGLAEGDLIIAVDGDAITGSRHLVGTVRGLVVGETAQVTVVRDGEELVLDVVLGVSPDL
ncbi:MAG: PDZ domain-containing protein [Microbacteriaceae bacterium]|nr:PDZ domain-containing protein [Microbacteriaceae bacterium]